jgi:hypothetical protein
MSGSHTRITPERGSFRRSDENWPSSKSSCGFSKDTAASCAATGPDVVTVPDPVAREDPMGLGRRVRRCAVSRLIIRREKSSWPAISKLPERRKSGPWREEVSAACRGLMC